MPAVNTSSVPTSAAMVLLRVHWFVADQARCAFVVARLYNAWRWEPLDAGASTSWLTETRKQRSSASYASLLGCMRCAPVCEVDCEDGAFNGDVGEAVVKLLVDIPLDSGDLFFEWFPGEGLLQAV